MFDVPGAKRIKRSHLFQDDDSSRNSRASTRSASPEDPNIHQQDDLANFSYGFEYDFVAPKSSETKSIPTLSDGALIDAEEPEEPEYHFRLFAPAPKSTTKSFQPETSAASVKVRLSATPEPAALAKALSLENAHFVRPSRPQSYYFTSELEGETIQQLKSEYEDAALSTSEVLSRAGSTKWPGTALPWRLIQVELLNKAPKAQRQVGSTTRSAQARARPSKKRRILFRRRLALRNELAAQSKVAEETEREKRTRRNREKKVKKKEREKRKKLDDADGVPGRIDGNSHPSKGETGGDEGAVETSATDSSAQKVVKTMVSSLVKTDADKLDIRADNDPVSDGNSSTTRYS